MVQKFSERLRYFRVERPSEWLMDDFAGDAERLEAQAESLQRERDDLREALEMALPLIKCYANEDGDAFSVDLYDRTVAALAKGASQ